MGEGLGRERVDESESRRMPAGGGGEWGEWGRGKGRRGKERKGKAYWYCCHCCHCIEEPRDGGSNGS